MKIRYHDANGRERWAAAGEIIPAGSYINNGQEKLDRNAIVNVSKSEGNPYDQRARPSYSLYIQEIGE